jgi:hypothetical protein
MRPAGSAVEAAWTQDRQAIGGPLAKAGRFAWSEEPGSLNWLAAYMGAHVGGGSTPLPHTAL